MKKVQDFEDYSLDLLLEAITQKEIPLIFSYRFKTLVQRIQHPISDKLLASERYGVEGKSSFVDLDDSGLDKVSFITSTKAAEVLADYYGKNKESEDIEFTRSNYLGVRDNDRMSNLMYSKFRSSTSIGKLINKLFPKEFAPGGKPGEDIQSFTDKFKSMRDTKDLELVKGDDIVKYYLYENYVDGDNAGGSLGNSCMRYDDCGDYVQFYADNIDKVSLLILKGNDEGDEDNSDKIKGRALVWNLSSPKGRVFMDRIYTTESYDEELFKTYAKKNGWLYKYRQNSSDGEFIIDTKDDSQEHMTLEVYNIKESSTDKYPYVDTLKYYYPEDGTLSSSDGGRGEKWTLEDTEGGYESDEGGIYVEYYGESYPEDDLVYCERGDEYRLEDDAVYLDFYNEYATEEYIDRNMVECDYYDGDPYRDQYDTVDVYGTDEVACKEYAANNLSYSDYYNEYLPEGRTVYSEHHETDLYDREAVEVYTDANQRNTDWRAEDDGTWWEWDHDNEKYDNDVTEEELREANDLEDEDDEDEENED